MCFCHAKQPTSNRLGGLCLPSSKTSSHWMEHESKSVVIRTSHFPQCINCRSPVFGKHVYTCVIWGLISSWHACKVGPIEPCASAYPRSSIWHTLRHALAHPTVPVYGPTRGCLCAERCERCQGDVISWKMGGWKDCMCSDVVRRDLTLFGDTCTWLTWWLWPTEVN